MDNDMDTLTDTYSMTCTCGQRISVDVADRDEAVERIRYTMDEDTIETHWREKHPGEAPLTVAEYHEMIELQTVEG